MDTGFLDVGGVPPPLRIAYDPTRTPPGGCGCKWHARLCSPGRVQASRRRRAAGEAEIIIVDLDIQRPQLVANDIRRVERVAVVLEPADDTYPEVLALRSDFPSVPHLNWRNDEFPRSLCLYDQSWDEVRTRWTASAFIERIRRGLRIRRRELLHRDDQPLEPLLFGTPYRLVIPADVLKVSGEDSRETRCRACAIRGASRNVYRQEAAFTATERPAAAVHRLDVRC